MAKKEKEQQTAAAESETNTPETEVAEELSAEQKLQNELAETKAKLLSLAAEFDNYQKRSAREKEQLSAFVKADVVKKLLPVVDNIAFAENSDHDSADYAKGLEMIIKQFKESLEKMGLSMIEAKGQPFDPNFHEAVMHVEDETLGENEVAEVLQAGYKLGETVLRPAMVKVAN